MRSFFTNLLILMFVLSGYSQEITVSFIGQLNNSEYCTMDSVVITNITRNWTESIVYPDTILVVGGIVGNNLNIVSTMGLEQNVPNPFDCETQVELTVLHREDVRMQLLDVAGHVCAEYTGSLNEGVHVFDISAADPQVYLLNAIIGNNTYSIRMVNVGSGCCARIKYSGIGKDIVRKFETTNEFELGDDMLYVGYVTIDGDVVPSDTVEQFLAESQCVTLRFTRSFQPNVETIDARPTINMTATLRGRIIDTGGSPIVACGFYYGISEDSLSHNVVLTEASTVFSDTLIGLSQGITYYYVAYATNSAGTGYGEVRTFIIGPVGEPGEPFTDTRDGNIYPTVIIGSQIWMAENLRYAGDIPLGSETSYVLPYIYYPHCNSSNVEAYGYLYNWSAAMNGASSSASNPSGVQGICPEGWHLPSNAEWTQLSNFLGGTTNAGAMLAGNEYLWTRGELTNSSYFGTTGFDALPAGFYGADYDDFGRSADFWSSTVNIDTNAYGRSIEYYSSVLYNSIGREYLGRSIRCVKD